MAKKKSSYYAITGCAVLYYEFMRVLPLLMDENSDRLLKDEVMNNNYMQVNSMTSRSRFIADFKLRYNSVPAEFWRNFIDLNEEGQRIGLLYVILRAYKLIYDFHFNVTIKRWNSVDRALTKSDIMMEFNELSAKDEFVDSWTEGTKLRCASQYLTILRQIGMQDPKSNELKALHSDDPRNFEYYFRTGEEWFLEACLLYPYEIEKLKVACQI
ncbi:MAG: DUF1819 family protein [Bacteroidales bacterium]|nr:DUF1819 family protein [Bacteroidales bacterium]